MDLNTTPHLTKLYFSQNVFILEIEKNKNKTKPCNQYLTNKCAAQIENNLESLQSGLNVHRT